MVQGVKMEEIIQVRGLSKVFKTQGGSVTALKDINLTIEKGDIFGIIGLSGAGKSTLVRCLNLLEKPTSGEVLLDGVSLTKLSKKELLAARQSMGMIFQGFNLLEQRTALKNICFPLEIQGMPAADCVKRARELLKTVGLEDKENAYPSQLSGGQKQRIAIARALATNPKVLLCDEATSALDPTTTVSILELLKSINESMGVTIIVITHEMRVIEKICNKVAVIDSSVIAETGKVSEIFANPRSAIARELILPDGKDSLKKISGGKKIRIVFDGEVSEKPIIANMILTCKCPVNIMFADTKDINGTAYGQMIIELPNEKEAEEKLVSYLAANNIKFCEEV